MLLTLRGTPFIYQGEELGLEDTVVTARTRVDPGGRDGSRAPLPWTVQAPHGWGPTPWLPFAADADVLSVQAQESAADSTLALYRRLLACRRRSTALCLGDWEELPSHPQVLAYRRHHEADERLVCINFADSEHAFPLATPWRVEIASDGQGEGQPFSGRLNPEQALILCR